ncbi:MAG TPA: class I SAM-dependent methyltransferase [Paenalcaligenes sp.]|nr:class I SAM-dependent methyltransferase [Paenalcaligenes sp.]
MMEIDQIDFSALYKEHFQRMDRAISQPHQWDARAEKVQINWQPDAYINTLLDAMLLQENETVLDVGSGAGDVALAVAMRGHQVHALDFSKKMLSRLMQRADALGCADLIATHCADWTDPTVNVPQCDVVVASRSTLIADMGQGLARLHDWAHQRVYVTYPFEAGQRTGPEFSRQHVGAGRIPPYYYLPSILYQKGQCPQMAFIKEPTKDSNTQTRWVLIHWDKQPWLEG